jgi:hypothetical protein
LPDPKPGCDGAARAVLGELAPPADLCQQVFEAAGLADRVGQSHIAGHRQQAVGDGAQSAAVAVAALAPRGITAAAERGVLGLIRRLDEAERALAELDPTPFPPR